MKSVKSIKFIDITTFLKLYLYYYFFLFLVKNLCIHLRFCVKGATPLLGLSPLGNKGITPCLRNRHDIIPVTLVNRSYNKRPNLFPKYFLKNSSEKPSDSGDLSAFVL